MLERISNHNTEITTDGLVTVHEGEKDKDLVMRPTCFDLYCRSGSGCHGGGGYRWFGDDSNSGPGYPDGHQ